MGQAGVIVESSYSICKGLLGPTDECCQGTPQCYQIFQFFRKSKKSNVVTFITSKCWWWFLKIQTVCEPNITPVGWLWVVDLLVRGGCCKQRQNRRRCDCVWRAEPGSRWFAGKNRRRVWGVGWGPWALLTGYSRAMCAEQYFRKMCLVAGWRMSQTWERLEYYFI